MYRSRLLIFYVIFIDKYILYGHVFIRWTLCDRSNHYKAQCGVCEDNPSVDIEITE